MMGKPSILFTAFVCICCTLPGASSFSLGKPPIELTQSPTTAARQQIVLRSTQHPSCNDDDESSSRFALDYAAGAAGASSADTTMIGGNNGGGIGRSLLAGCTAFLITATPLSAFATEALEVEELPPVFVPILFAIAVLGGVGVLTASLGNVMDEEASLGLQSGARAKKERDRSRSSYFKK